jgi:hypothetical protein
MRASRLKPAGFRLAALAVMVAIAACAGVPTASKSTKKTSTKTATSKVSPAKATSSKQPTPAPSPSLGLLLEGQVAVEPGALLDGKLAQVTSTGVKLISNNGGGIISDNGLGIISDNGLGIISDNGLGIISNHAGGYRIASLGNGLKAVEGMAVSAVSLLDGRLLAGPVATKADGTYKLGFLTAPERNMRIVASVPSHEKDAQYTYETLIPPKAAPVLTSDATRAVSDYTIGALVLIFQPFVERAKSDAPPSVNPNNPDELKEFAALMYKIGPKRVTELDQDGALAKLLAGRLVSWSDLDTQAFKDLMVLAEEVRAFGASLSTPVTPSMVDQAIPLMQHKEDRDKLIALFTSHGMDEAKATDLADKLKAKGDAVAQQLILTLLIHKTEVFKPFQELADQATP